MKVYRCTEYYKLHILIFEISALDICEEKSGLAKVLFWNSLIESLRCEEY